MRIFKFVAFTSLLCLFFTISCKKDKSTTDEIKTEELQQAASYNSGITEGVGNLFYTEKFSSNQSAQLVAKLAYKSDSLFFLGSTDQEAKLISLHTVILSKGKQQYLVTEFLPDQLTAISYVIVNGIKGKLVYKMRNLSATEREVSLLKYDWKANTFVVLNAGLYQEDKLVATQSAETSEAGKPVENACSQPDPSGADEIDNSLDKHLLYIACKKMHPINTFFNKLIDEYLSKPDPDITKEEPDLLKKSYPDMASGSQAVTGNTGKYKSAKINFGNTYEWLKLQLKQFVMELQGYNAILKLSPEDSDLEFKEGRDTEIKVVLKLTNPSTGSPLSTPALVTVGISKPGQTTALYSASTYTSKDYGKAIFTIKPADMGISNETAQLQGYFDFKENNLSKKQTFTIDLKWIAPQLLMITGNSQQAVKGKKLANPLLIQIIDQDGSAVKEWPVSWTVKSGNGFLTTDIKTDALGYARAEWTFGNDLDEQVVEASARKKDGTLAAGAPKLFKASALDSIKLYNEAMVGDWTETWHIQGNTSTSKYHFYKDGTGEWYWERTAEGLERFIEPSKPFYKIRWTISGVAGNYKMYMSFPNQGWNLNSPVYYSPVIHYGDGTGLTAVKDN